MQTLKTDICVIGAGSGGLSVAAAVAAFGVPVVLLEDKKMGGDCLNTGCVPSKALLAAAKKAHLAEESAAFGVTAQGVKVDFAAVNRHVHEVIAAIEPNDSVERFEGLGVQVIRERGRFISPTHVVAGDKKIEARRFVIATGSRAAVPPIKGLEETPYLTNETIFEQTTCPEHLIVIGAGPIGLEMAQAHRRLGARVSVVEAFRPLAKDDPELAAVLLRALREDGITIHEGVKIEAVSGKVGKIAVEIVSEGNASRLEGTHLLVAAGRRANIEDLGLEEAGIKTGRGGIEVTSALRTSNKRVYAIGDVVAGGLQFTHVAGLHAGIITRSLLFRLPATFSPDSVPWCTYTDPELAWVGLGEQAARERFGARVSVLSWPFSENDRAQAERRTEGLVKLVLGPRQRLVGAGVVGLGAGEMINLLSLAIAKRLRIGALVGFVSPYPTLSEVVRRAAVSHYAPAAKKPVVRNLLRFLRRFG